MHVPSQVGMLVKTSVIRKTVHAPLLGRHTSGNVMKPLRVADELGLAFERTDIEKFVVTILMNI